MTVTYTSYEELLLEYNWTGNGKSGYTTQLPTTGLTSVGGVYTIGYNFLIDTNSMELAAYYDTPLNDDGSDTLYDPEFDYFRSVTTAQQDAVEIIMHADVGYDYSYSAFFSDVANVNFSADTPQSAELLIAQNDGSSGEYPSNSNPAYTKNYVPPSTQPVEEKYGDIWINEDFTLGWSDPTEQYSPQFWSLLHELGHSLGLKGDDLLSSSVDSQQFTIMSYNLLDGMDPSGSSNDAYASSLQLLDIAAIQAIYGANTSTRSGNTTYKDGQGFGDSVSDAFIYTIWDGAGEDTIDASGYADKVIINLNDGEFSSIGKAADSSYSGSRGTGLADNNVAIAFGAEIENAIGTAYADTLIGNALSNELVGGSGSDVLDGGAGNDILNGGKKADTYIFELGDGSDQIIDEWDSKNHYEFGAGISAQDITYDQQGDDLVLTINQHDSLTLSDFFLETDIVEEVFEFSGSTDLKLLSRSTGSLYGTAENDIMFSKSTLSTTQGLGGDDLIFGSSGNDIIFGDTDKVPEYYDIGNDTLYGGDGDDSVHGGLGADKVYGGAGNDLISAAGGYLYGEDGNDTLRVGRNGYGSSLTNYAYGGDGNDYFDTRGNQDFMWGGLGNDKYEVDTLSQVMSTIYEEGGTDDRIVAAFDSSDAVVSLQGNSLLLESAIDGTDLTLVVDFALSTGNQLEKIQFSDGVFAVSALLSNTIFGTAGNDTLSGSALDEIILGFEGDDILVGNAGNDTIDGGDGFDTVDFSSSGAVTVNLQSQSASDGTDIDVLRNIELVLGSGYNDSLTGDGSDNSFIGGSGDDTIDGGDGIDTVDYSSASDAVSVDLGNSVATDDGEGDVDTLTNIENVIGSDYEDTIIGNGLANELHGGDGDDTLRGGDGDDVLYGGDGNDNLYGDGGSDTLYGEAGHDYLNGKELADTLYGGDDNDVVLGHAGDDILYGDAGTDSVQGGLGNDTIYGGTNADNLWGDDGDDVFVFMAADLGTGVDDIKDFDITTESDAIDISDILAGIYDSATDDLTDFVIMVDSGSNSKLHVDTTGTAGAGGWQQVALIRNVTGMTDEDQLVLDGTLIV